MKNIDTAGMAKFRFEYKEVASPLGQRLLWRRRWRLYLDGVRERVAPEYFESVRALLPEGHPAHNMARYLYNTGDTLDEILPFRPFVPSKELVEAMGVGFVDRAVVSERPVQVHAGEDGWSWWHAPGDAII